MAWIVRREKAGKLSICGFLVRQVASTGVGKGRKSSLSPYLGKILFPNLSEITKTQVKPEQQPASSSDTQGTREAATAKADMQPSAFCFRGTYVAFPLFPLKRLWPSSVKVTTDVVGHVLTVSQVGTRVSLSMVTPSCIS